MVHASCQDLLHPAVMLVRLMSIIIYVEVTTLVWTSRVSSRKRTHIPEEFG